MSYTAYCPVPIHEVDGAEHGYGIGWLSDGIPEEIRKAETELGFEDYCLNC